MSDVLEKVVNISGTNVTITTTTETVIVTSPPIVMQYQTGRAIIKAWATLTTGAATTTVTPRIRRTALVGGALVGEANAETVKAAAGSNEVFGKVASETRSNEEALIYSLTLEQASATGDGTVLEAGIEVELLNG